MPNKYDLFGVSPLSSSRSYLPLLLCCISVLNLCLATRQCAFRRKMQRSKHNGLQKATSAPDKMAVDIGNVSLGFLTNKVQLGQDRLRGKAVK